MKPSPPTAPSNSTSRPSSLPYLLKPPAPPSSTTPPSPEQTHPSDTVYGLFMCRGDVPPDLCRECVVNATQRLENTSSLVCPFGKGAIIWYDECFVRYSNRNFFSTVDTRPRMRLRNTENVTDP
ncbi:hypothetical protein L6164_032163 [Bauhinia variegata]|uniref:Uncharacterized protein n=1 Tax=Bauhinia variegata TaxID=167791 RepID=A0ACB9KN09_BAUVA|nr:hypothetical protein L6164_032163 [Bauhinia variegata]